jgi:hypothetical protein
MVTHGCQYTVDARGHSGFQFYVVGRVGRYNYKNTPHDLDLATPTRVHALKISKGLSYFSPFLPQKEWSAPQTSEKPSLFAWEPQQSF